MSIGTGSGTTEVDPAPETPRRASMKWKLTLFGLIGMYVLLAAYGLIANFGGIGATSPAAATSAASGPSPAPGMALAGEVAGWVSGGTVPGMFIPGIEE